MTSKQQHNQPIRLTPDEVDVINVMRMKAKLNPHNKAVTVPNIPDKPDTLVSKLTCVWSRNGMFVTIGLGSRLVDVLKDDVYAHDGSKTIANTWYGTKVYLQALPRFKRIMKEWNVTLVFK